ncbi:hypothetical protein GPALN_003193 [Globodera pallida]|nr:hypothetical protein GPALN_003193 [Globodera pallida]
MDYSLLQRRRRRRGTYFDRAAVFVRFRRASTTAGRDEFIRPVFVGLQWRLHHRQQQPMGEVHGQPFEPSAVMARYGGAMPKLPTEKAAGMMACTSQQILPPEHQMGYYEGPPAECFPRGIPR